MEHIPHYQSGDRRLKLLLSFSAFIYDFSGLRARVERLHNGKATIFLGFCS